MRPRAAAEISKSALGNKIAYQHNLEKTLAVEFLGDGVGFVHVGHEADQLFLPIRIENRRRVEAFTAFTGQAT